jgi:hypothetical protein
MTNDLNEKRIDRLEERVEQLEDELAEMIPAREPAPVLCLVKEALEVGAAMAD